MSFAIGVIFMVVGGLAAAAGNFMVLAAAFRAGIFWGLGSLLLPIVALGFVAMNWEQTKKGFLISLVGTIPFYFGAWLVDNPDINKALGLPVSEKPQAEASPASPAQDKAIARRPDPLPPIVPAGPPPAPPTTEEVLAACKGEIGLVCQAVMGDPAATLRCLKESAHGLLEPCQAKLAALSP